MRDPHVERLHYSVGSGSETISYENPEPLSFSNELGAFDLREGAVEIVPAEHFATEEEARRAIEPFLRSWEIATDVNENPGAIRFKFVRADLIDRDPPPPGTAQVYVQTGNVVLVGHAATAHITCRRYPPPPQAFVSTTDVERAHRRWLNYRHGKEPLQAMAYFVLTLLESRAGKAMAAAKRKRRTAAKIFGIEDEVLSKVGSFSTEKGNAATARKVPSDIIFQELTPVEQTWLEQAVRRIILRLGEHASGEPYPTLRMSNLPQL